MGGPGFCSCFQSWKVHLPSLLYTHTETRGERCLARRQVLDNWGWFTTFDPGEEGALEDAALRTLLVLKAVWRFYSERAKLSIKCLLFKDCDHVWNAV